MSRRLSAWLLFLWGPLIWFAHFGFVYAAASIELTLRPSAGLASRIAIGLATLGALALLWPAWRQPERWTPGEPGSDLFRFWISASRLLCLVAAVAIIWQALPALIVP